VKILDLSIGEEDYGRKNMVRLTILDVSIALGHDYSRWIAVNIDIEWGHGWYWGAGRVLKEIKGEQFFEMLLRRNAPGWIDR
jgi:hypothetical protein